MNLNSILIGSEDPKRLAEYYSRLFGEPRWDEGGYTGWQIGNGGANHDAPPVVVTSTPPSLATTMRFGFFGSIHRSCPSAWCIPL